MQFSTTTFASILSLVALASALPEPVATPQPTLHFGPGPVVLPVKLCSTNGPDAVCNSIHVNKGQCEDVTLNGGSRQYHFAYPGATSGACSFFSGNGCTGRSFTGAGSFPSSYEAILSFKCV